MHAGTIVFLLFLPYKESSDERKLPNGVLILTAVVADPPLQPRQHRAPQRSFEQEKKTSDDLISVYEQWIRDYPLISIEDGLSEEDWESWKRLNKRLGSKVQLVGDDLFVTNQERLQRGIEE